MRISVVVPVYNEDRNIQPCLRALSEALAGREHEILVCYDFDGDTTLAAIEAMPDRPAGVRLVKNTLGAGVATAMRAGFAAAQGHVVVTTMADLSDPPSVIPAMADRIAAGAHVVSGSRYRKGGSQTGGPALKRLMSRAAGLTLRWIAGLGTHDATNNFRAYERNFLKTVPCESVAGFELGLEMTVKAHLHGFKVAEVPTTWTDRTAGASRFRIAKWLPHYLRWYLRAMATPLAVWGALVAAAIASPWALVALPVLLAARHVRGRMRLIDALFPLAWMAAHPAVAAALSVAHHALVARMRDGPAFFVSKAGRMWPAVVACALVWIASLAIPQPPHEHWLDFSWRMAQNRLFRDGAQAGVDYVFPYGPLGCFVMPVHDRALFGGAVLWQLIVKLLTVALVVRAAGPARWPAILVLFFTLPLDENAACMLAIVASAVLFCRSGNGPDDAAACLALPVVLATAKLTFAMLAFGCMLVMAAAAWRRRGWAAGLAVVGIALLLRATVWTACGQSLANVPQYVAASFEIMRGYGQTMALTGDRTQLIAGLVAGGLALVLLALERREPFVGLAVLGGLAIAWSSGFVRHDASHALGFFCVAAVAPLLVARSGRAAEVARYAAVLVSIWSVLGISNLPRTLYFEVPRPPRKLVRNAAALATIGAHRDACDRGLEQLARGYDLPRVRERIGGRTVDIMSYDQAVLLLNGFAWRPRPVYQGYSAYTPALQRMNAEFFRGPGAPDFVLFTPQTIDGRHPMMDDAEALWEVFARYRPALVEKSWLLLERTDRVRAAGELRLERDVADGETVDLGERGKEVLRLAVEADGRRDIEVAGGDGQTHRWTIFPSMTGHGFMLAPILRDQYDWVLRRPSSVATAFRIRGGPARVRVWREPIGRD